MASYRVIPSGYAEAERRHGDVMTLRLYEIPITPALLPSRNHMAMSAT
jgi:hypothetical protein